MNKVLLTVLSVFLVGFLIACGATDDYSDTPPPEASTNYTIEVLAEDNVVLVSVVERANSNISELALGIEEVAKTYNILEVTPLTIKIWSGSTTAAVVLLVEPLK